MNASNEAYRVVLGAQVDEFEPFAANIMLVRGYGAGRTAKVLEVVRGGSDVQAFANHLLSLIRTHKVDIVAGAGGYWTIVAQWLANALAKSSYSDAVVASPVMGAAPPLDRHRRRYHNARAQCSIMAAMAIRDERMQLPPVIRLATDDLVADILTAPVDPKRRHHCEKKDSMFSALSMAFLEGVGGL